MMATKYIGLMLPYIDSFPGFPLGTSYEFPPCLFTTHPHNANPGCSYIPENISRVDVPNSSGISLVPRPNARGGRVWAQCNKRVVSMPRSWRGHSDPLVTRDVMQHVMIQIEVLL